MLSQSWLPNAFYCCKCLLFNFRTKIFHRLTVFSGSGFVAKPTLNILTESGIKVTVNISYPALRHRATLWSFLACRNIKNALKLSEGVQLAKPISLDVTNDQALDAAVAQHDLIISLIPYTFHATVIKSAIQHKKHVMTTSYISPSILKLDQQAKDTGITVINEIGVSLSASLLVWELSNHPQLNPGIDHLYAVSVIKRVHQARGKIKSFVSYYGGLTAPEGRPGDSELEYMSWLKTHRFQQPIRPQASKSRILDRRLLTLFPSRFSWSYVPHDRYIVF